jgi:NADPH:quinone reductase-like Zn-dependent oxidoreductase
VLVELRGVGVCHTDMVMRDGLLPVPMPVVLGHEGAGVVLRTGSEVTGLAVGDHVVLSFASCGDAAPVTTMRPLIAAIGPRSISLAAAATVRQPCAIRQGMASIAMFSANPPLPAMRWSSSAMW